MMPAKLLLTLPLLALASCGQNSISHQIDLAQTGRKMVDFQQKFDLFDTDGDGYLDRDELTRGFTEAGYQNVTDENVTKVIEFYDFNKDGKISLRETQSGAVTGPEELIKKLDR